MATRLAHRSSSNSALAGEDLTVFIRREDAERFIEEVRGDEPEVAAKLWRPSELGIGDWESGPTVPRYKKHKA